MRPFLGPAVSANTWRPVSPDLLHEVAVAQNGKSAGIDGFTGAEIASLPLALWQDAAVLFNAFEESGFVPTQWCDIKQVHIPKPGKGRRVSDNAVNVSSLRPISVLSIWFRIYASARRHSVDAQQWIESWWPENAFGGRKHISTTNAIFQILQDAEANRYVAAFDYSLAFDMTDPNLVLRIFAHKGMPAGWSNILKSIWTDQRRLLIYGTECLDSMVEVSHSLPQGDPWAMAAMTALLLPALSALKTECPRVHTVTFVDDRTVTAATIDDCLQAEAVWQRWSAILGLKENTSKSQYYHRTEQGRNALIHAGLDRTKVSDCPQILGTCLIGTGKRALTPAEENRLRKARAAAERCACLPVDPRLKLQFVAATAIPQAAFGWLAKRPAVDDLKPFNRALRKCTWKHDNADPHLARILRGHSVDLQFRIASEFLTSLWRVTQARAFVPKWNSGCTSMKTLANDYAKWMDWRQSRPGVFACDLFREVLSFVSPAPRQALTTIEHMKHSLRETWRRMLFQHWSNTTRNDAEFCHNDLQAAPVYCAQRCALARKRAFHSAHTFAVLSGAFVSPYRIVLTDRRSKYPEQMGTCSHCNCLRDFMHWCWDCHDIAAAVDAVGGRPQDPLLTRLGWPRAHEARKDLQILLHLADRREEAVAWRLAHAGCQL